jgi:hypothetical protein
MGIDRGVLERKEELTEWATEIKTERNKEMCLAERTEHRQYGDRQEREGQPPLPSYWKKRHG